MLEHDTEASPVSEELDVTASSSPAEEAAPAASSDVKEEAKPALVDVLRDVVEPKADASEASSASDAAKTEPAETGDTAKAEETDNFEGLPFGRHPRFKAVLEERNLARTEVNDLKAKTAELEAPAKQYAAIEQFMVTNGISAEETVNLFKLAALSKNDPEGALRELQPLLSDLWSRTGRLLPDDIRKDIEEGRLTEDRGKELSQERARRAESERRATEATERATTVETSVETERRTAAINAAITEWEAATKGKDPDFERKEELVGDRCRALIAEKGQPTTPEATKALLTQAHKDVTERLRKVMPSRPEVKRHPGSTSSSNTAAQPKNLLEAVTLAAG